MEALKDAAGHYEVERRARHLERPGFRINELQLSPTQTVPWHYHSTIVDTIYVLEGSLRVHLQDPKETIDLAPSESLVTNPSARTSSPSQAKPRPLS
jgi:quercetin dioxygenase-like cupin family protein